MSVITVEAIYKDGILKPKTKLDLPDNTLVEVSVTPIPKPASRRRSLFGAFPELALLTEDEFEWAKRLWEHGLEKQSRILNGLE
jgi:predicted DNA-binding antitoxin AbrB/MazE fold protein